MMTEQDFKNALEDLKYYEFKFAHDKKDNFWTRSKNTADLFLTVSREILAQPFTEKSFNDIVLLRAVFLSLRMTRDLSACEKFMYALGNILYLGTSLSVPLIEWYELAEKARKLLLVLTEPSQFKKKQLEIDNLMTEMHVKKETYRSHPVIGALIAAQDQMGG